MKRLKRITTVILTFLMLFSLGNGVFAGQAVYAADTETIVGDEVEKVTTDLNLLLLKMNQRLILQL